MKPNRCFIDTGAFVALNHAKDQYHQTALEIALSLDGYQFVVSDAVVSETYALLRYRLGFHIAHRFLSTVLENDEYHILEVIPSTRALAAELLQKYNDQKISYADALTVALMKKNDIEFIFAFDHHFDIMGVKRVS